MILLFVVVATMNMYAQIAVNDRGHVAKLKVINSTVNY